MVEYTTLFKAAQIIFTYFFNRSAFENYFKIIAPIMIIIRTIILFNQVESVKLFDLVYQSQAVIRI